MKKAFYREIHLARALTLLFVVLGHSLIGDDVISGALVRMIYSFHMGTFFFLSGFVAAPSLLHPQDRSLGGELLKRVKRLLIPYLFFSLCTILIKALFSDVVSNAVHTEDILRVLIGDTPNGSLWFLWTLFVMACLFLLVSGIRAAWQVLLATGCICYVLYLWTPFFFLTSVLRYALYYAVGISVQNVWESVRTLPTTSAGRICGILCLSAVPVLSLGFTGVPYPFTCLFGTAGIMFLCIILAGMEKKRTTVLSLIADYSYDIYLLSYFVQQPIRLILYERLRFPYPVAVALMLVCGILVPYLLSRFLLRKSAICRRVMFGMNERSPA